MDILIPIALLFVGYFTGQYFEKKHYKSIRRREKILKKIPVISGQWKNHLSDDEEGLVFGAGTVVASDYFKSFVNRLRNLVGGRMTSYESLLDRGRREAILRMKAKAAEWGAEKIINMRIETSTIGNSAGKRGIPCVELFAYGTAIKKKQ